jgi:hypothetical protein
MVIQMCMYHLQIRSYVVQIYGIKKKKIIIPLYAVHFAGFISKAKTDS